MQGATLEELRDLSARSRRTLAWGMIASAGSLVLLPLAFYAADAMPRWSAWSAGLAIVLGGSLFVRFAHVAGQERGAFRALFRAARERALARTLVPDGATPEKSLRR